MTSAQPATVPGQQVRWLLDACEGLLEASRKAPVRFWGLPESLLGLLGASGGHLGASYVGGPLWRLLRSSSGTGLEGSLRGSPAGPVLGSSWWPLGPSWGPFGPSGGILEAFGRLGPLLGASWGGLGSLLGLSWGSLGPSWGPLGGFRGRLGGILEAAWAVMVL